MLFRTGQNGGDAGPGKVTVDLKWRVSDYNVTPAGWLVCRAVINREPSHDIDFVLYLYNHLSHVRIVASVSAQQYVGCYRDSGGDNRVMSSMQYTHDSMTIDMCQQDCQQSPRTYFGLEVRMQLYVIKTRCEKSCRFMNVTATFECERNHLMISFAFKCRSDTHEPT